MASTLPALTGTPAFRIDRARIKRARAAATVCLGDKISAFLAACKTGQIFETLKHKPFSSDLIPFFEQYALAVFDAMASEAKSFIGNADDVEPYLKWLSDRIEPLVMSIARRDGVWHRVVDQCCRRASLGWWGSPYGFYTADAFRRSHHQVIRAALELRIQLWTYEAWEVVANLEPVAHASTRKVANGPLARNLDRLMTECGWSYDDCVRASGVDKTLIIDHVKHGAKANPGTLKKYATAFSEKLKRPIEVAELTRDGETSTENRRKSHLSPPIPL
jgi:hypothetical protein